MRKLRHISAVSASGLAALLLIATVGCREDIQSPSSPEPTGATSATPPLEAAVAANSWTTRPAMPQYRDHHAIGAAANASGQWIVYVFGGNRSDGDTGLPIVSYNVVTNTWSTVPNTVLFTASTNGVGKNGSTFYITGGESCCADDFSTFNTTWAFQASTGRVLQKANMPRATKFGVSGVINGKLYVLPGYCSGESVDPGHCVTGGFIRALYRYDPSTNSWISRAPPPHNHAGGASAVIANKLYVVGNSSSRTTYLDVYDPAINTWQTKASIPKGGDELYGANLNEKFFVISASFVSGSPSLSTKAYWYTPSTNTWSIRAAPPNGKAGPIVKVIINGTSRLFLASSSGPSYLYTP